MQDKSSAKILIVEDEVQINRLIELVLQSGGYKKIQKAYNGLSALEIINKDKPDLILLDVMMPELDGFELLKKIKNDENLKTIQVIMLTARKMEEDVLLGFNYGAIDYIAKPFSNKILLARINAHLQNIAYASILKYKNLTLDVDKKIVKLDDKIINLTKFELVLLEMFLKNTGVVFSRAQLLNFLRGNDGFDVSLRAVDVQIVNLRKKLKEFSSNIETVRGIGYKLKED